MLSTSPYFPLAISASNAANFAGSRPNSFGVAFGQSLEAPASCAIAVTAKTHKTTAVATALFLTSLFLLGDCTALLFIDSPFRLKSQSFSEVNCSSG